MPTARAGVRRLTLFAVLAASAVAVMVVPSSDAVVAVAAPRPPVGEAPTSSAPANIVYVVIDDMSSNLLPYMSNVGALADEGVTFDDFIVTDSQCCPSRASTLTGLYPHNTEVLTNTWPDGGYDKFAQKYLNSSMGPRLSEAGYRTGFIGKYLNGYEPGGTVQRSRHDAPGYAAGFVPPGWNEWHVAGNGYPEFDYTLADAVDQPVADLNAYGHEPEDYLTDVLSERSTDFLDRAAVGDAPFFLTIAPFATHSRVGGKDLGESMFPPAPRDRAASTDRDLPASWPAPDFPDGDCGSIEGGCAAVPFPDPADADSFNKVPKQANGWIRDQRLRKRQIEALHQNYLDRIRMAQSVDDLVGQLKADLDQLGLSDETYIVFTSDNGYHLGEHALRRGKNSAFDTDIRVPLIVVPPGGARQPVTVSALVQNTDFLPTFLDIAGNTKPERKTDGESLLPWITSPDVQVPGWRQGALVQYATGTGKDSDGSPAKAKRSDPDRDSTGTPPPYFALRAPGYVYVDYSDRKGVASNRSAEFYDLANDPAASVNQYRQLSGKQKKALSQAVQRYQSCSGGGCAAAGRRIPEISIPPG